MAIIINIVRLLISEILRSLNGGYFGRYNWELSGNINKISRRQIGSKLAAGRTGPISKDHDVCFAKF